MSWGAAPAACLHKRDDLLVQHTSHTHTHVNVPWYICSTAHRDAHKATATAVHAKPQQSHSTMHMHQHARAASETKWAPADAGVQQCSTLPCAAAQRPGHLKSKTARVQVLKSTDLGRAQHAIGDGRPLKTQQPGLRSKVLLGGEHKRRVVAARAVGCLHDAGALVLAHAALEKVGLALQADHLHPVKGVGHAPQLLVAKRQQQPVGHKLDVLAHEVGVDAHQAARKRLGAELELQLHRLGHDGKHLLLRQLALQVAVQRARKVGVQALVTGDELVGEGEAGHQAALLEPEDGAEGAREEDALHGGEGH
mmetsp:Transcript_23987/g.61075  ORF Transcript_23987/g.61075 Transcript_23987/m.61075 type:complete len:309 (-) Transcript_23987:646-1572(-)